jgi:flavin-dependent dehydrogenase
MRQPCKPNDLLAFKANYAGASLLAGLLPLLSFEGGYGGMVVAGQGMLTLACCVRRDRLAVLRRASPGLPAGEVVEAMLKRECAGVQDALIGASRTGPWLASGPLAPGTRVRAEDQVFRVGNAAAEAHPIIGEGISMALQSAWLLSNRLTSTRDRLALADTGWQRAVGQGYCRDWHRHFARRLRLASAFAHLAMRPAFASPLMAMVRVWPGLLPWGAEWGGKTRFIHPTGHTP